MIHFRRVAGLGVAAAFLACTTACSGYVSPRFGGGDDVGPQPGYDEFVEQNYPAPEPPTEQEIQQMSENWLSDSWSCSYSPTFNDDWYDDVLCSRGTESHRPYLREWDSFVTEDEMRQSAQEYEAQLNASP